MLSAIGLAEATEIALFTWKLTQLSHLRAYQPSADSREKIKDLT